MKKILVLVTLAAVIAGCTEEKEKVSAKYDAMTGEKLPDKIDHMKDLVVESKKVWVIDNPFSCRVTRITVEDHVYYTIEGCHALVHSEACPCKSNNVERNLVK